MTNDIFPDRNFTKAEKPENPPLFFILSPRSADCELWPQWWTPQGYPNWRKIFSAYGHREIWEYVETGELEPWIEQAYIGWLKRNNRDHLIDS